MPDEGRIVDEGEMGKVGKQIRLPWSKAVEIAIKSMKVRFGRSLVTTSSIVLAIAFLMSILTSTTLVTSLKTEPVRNVIELRRVAEDAKQGKNVGLAFPHDVTVESTPEEISKAVESTRKRTKEFDKQIQAGTATALDKRLGQAELDTARTELNALLKTEAIHKARNNWPALQATVDLIAAENEALKTESGRRVARLRKRIEKARTAKSPAFPDDLTVESAQKQVADFEQALKGAKAGPDRRLLEARLAAARAGVNVLRDPKDAKKARAEWRVLRVTAELVAAENAWLETEPGRRVAELRERAERAKKRADIGLGFPADLTAESTRERMQELDGRLKAEEMADDEKRLLQARLAVARAEFTVVHNPDEIQKAKSAWPALRARADMVRSENEWTLLWRNLQKEGYTDVELEITATEAPPRLSYLNMLLRHMDPRDRWLALLAALVCFVGILNAMLMSVHERFREIGTMKCLGALESFIVKLYFLESSFIGMVGTLIGIVIGFILSMVRAMSAFGITTVYENFDFGGAMLSAFGTLLIGSFLSVGAAIFPARSAAKMDPVVAMRVDE